ncbi:MAG: type I-B CRISPR-associated protein Cas7/Cst2/DevR [Desulfotomaculum sp.]|nr:type I-B CRISPR-associated protein Cas7/Cst2/DevR [Desulfotomaculum sp.]
MQVKCICLTWLARADLSNLNSGEGSGNLTELKTYDRGRKPYVSGQATRTALFETMARSHPEHFKCTAELPCADVENCWGCDLRGYLATEEGVGGDRRWSPLKVSPGMGQIPAEIVTDLLTRASVVQKEGKESKDNRIAHVQLTENIYKFSLVIDTANVGRVQVPKIEGKGNKQRFAGWDTAVDISPEQRIERINAVLDAVFNLSGFAKQARASASMAPEVILISLQPTYNQRGIKALELNAEGEVNLQKLQSMIEEHKAMGCDVLFGHTPGVVANDQQLVELLEKQNIEIMPVYAAFNKAKNMLAAGV